MLEFSQRKNEDVYFQNQYSILELFQGNLEFLHQHTGTFWLIHIEQHYYQNGSSIPANLVVKRKERFCIAPTKNWKISLLQKYPHRLIFLGFLFILKGFSHSIILNISYSIMLNMAILYKMLDLFDFFIKQNVTQYSDFKSLEMLLFNQLFHHC